MIASVQVPNDDAQLDTSHYDSEKGGTNIACLFYLDCLTPCCNSQVYSHRGVTINWILDLSWLWPFGSIHDYLIPRFDFGSIFCILFQKCPQWVIAFTERHPNLGYGFESRFFCRRSIDGWILGCTSGILRRFFCRGGWHHNVMLPGNKEKQVWMTSDKGRLLGNNRLEDRRSLSEQNLHTSGIFYLITFQLQCSSIFTGWKYLCRIFSLSSRNLFWERLHWRTNTSCGRGKIIFRGK